MRISLNSGSVSVHTGYGHAFMKILNNLGKTNHSVLLDRPGQIEFCFSHPNFYKFNEDSYKIGYTAWESTTIPDSWKEHLEQLDEMWVPNQFCKDVFSKYTDKEIYIFPHGVDDVFFPILREEKEVTKFLHIGYPAYRKNTHDTINSFLKLYTGRTDVHLTIKGYAGYKLNLDEPNITYIEENMQYKDYVKMLHDHDILLYPSWGEGFGLIPLQALATGMPVIMTDGWCDYKEFCPELLIKSELIYSPWQDSHPGKMFSPDLYHFEYLMEYAKENIDGLFNLQYARAKKLHEKYNWEKVVSEHFDSVEARLMV